jgi:hypothetical protein
MTGRETFRRAAPLRDGSKDARRDSGVEVGLRPQGANPTYGPANIGTAA